MIDGFEVDGTSCSGLYCAYEDSYNTRVPSNVKFQNGTVANGGTFDGTTGWPGQPGNRYGIDYEEVGSVGFENIVVSTPKSRGVSGQAPKGTVSLSNVEVKDAPESGFDLRAQTLNLDSLTANGTGEAGIFVGDSGLVRYGVLKAINTSKTDTLRRAFWFENNSQIRGTQLQVQDDQATPTGYVVGAYGTQSGAWGKIYSDIKNGKVQIENQSNLSYESATNPPASNPPTSNPPASNPPTSNPPVGGSGAGGGGGGGGKRGHRKGGRRHGHHR